VRDLVLFVAQGLSGQSVHECSRVQAGQFTASRYDASWLREASSSTRCGTFIPVRGQRKRRWATWNALQPQPVICIKGSLGAPERQALQRSITRAPECPECGGFGAVANCPNKGFFGTKVPFTSLTCEPLLRGRETQGGVMTTLQAICFGAMLAWTPSLVVLALLLCEAPLDELQRDPS